MELRDFERLAGVAAGELPPVPEVRAAVRARLPAQPGWSGPTPAFAAACWAVAAVLAVAGWPAWVHLTDPWLGALCGLGSGWLL